MMVISITRSGDMASISLSGCPLRCGYCMHNKQDRKEMSLEKVVSELTNPAVKRAYIGGMDPSVQKKEVRSLITILNQRGLSVSVKTSGNDPDFLQEVLPFIDRFVFEIKAPIDDVVTWSRLSGRDPEWIEGFLERLMRSLEIVKSKNVKIVTRVIPGYIDEVKVKRMAEQLRPYAHESSLNQFLGNLMNDYPWNGLTEPSPTEAIMESYGKIMSEHIPLVKITGSGFDRRVTR